MRTVPRLPTVLIACALAGGAAWAKLPAPNDEAKAKAAEAAAKTAWTNKVADFHLCKSMDRVAAGYAAQAAKAGKRVKPAPTPPCADPGPFVYTPAVAVAAAAPPAGASAPAAATKPAAAPASAPKPAAPAASAASKAS